jgi:hypothetical protein
MTGKCSFAPDINKCPYFMQDNEGCSNTDKVCSFYRKMEQNKEVVEIRQEKWFEKYYK